MARRAREGGLVTVRGGITGHLKTELAFCNYRINAAKCQDLPHVNPLPFMNLTEDEKTLFSSKITLQYMSLKVQKSGCMTLV